MTALYGPRYATWLVEILGTGSVAYAWTEVAARRLVAALEGRALRVTRTESLGGTSIDFVERDDSEPLRVRGERAC